MKRGHLLLILFIMMLTLCGCGEGFFASRRNMEHLRPIQTISLDRSGEGLVMGVSSGIGPEDAPPLVMKCEASGIEAAISRLQSYSPEDELFYAHVRYILLGESMGGRSILPVLDWVERSPAMRMDTEMLLVRGSAADTLTGAAGDTCDITQRLASLDREETARGQHIYTLREIAASLLERGCALCLAVRPASAENIVFPETQASAAVVPVGYAVLREGREPIYLTAEETLGAELLSGSVNGALAEADDSVLELFSPGAEVSGLWDENGAPAGLLIRVRLKAGLLEREGETDTASLERALSSAAEGWIAAAVARAQAAGCDFSDLEGAAAAGSPSHARLDDFAAAFPDLPVTVTAVCELNRSYDISDQDVLP